MLKKLGILIAVFFINIILLKGQQITAFSTVINQNSIINAASVNQIFFLEDIRWRIGIAHRRQLIWSGLGGPQTYMFSIENNSPSKIQLFNRLKTYTQFGGHLITDKIGPTNTTSGAIRLGAILMESPSSSKKNQPYGIMKNNNRDVNTIHTSNFGVSFACNLGFSSYQIDPSEISFFEPNDQAAQNIFRSRTLLFIDPGLYFFKRTKLEGSKRNQFMLGLSMQQMNFQNLIAAISTPEEHRDFRLNKTPHWNLTGEWVRLGADAQYVSISGWLKYAVDTPINGMLNLKIPCFNKKKIDSNNKIWFSIAAGTSSAFDLLEPYFTIQGAVWYIIVPEKKSGNQYHLNFSIELPSSQLLTKFGPSIEFNANYFCKPNKRRK